MQNEWFDRLDSEYANIHRALWWLKERGPLEHGLQLAGALGWYWCRRDQISDGLRWLQSFRESAADSASAGSRARAAYFQGWLQALSGPAHHLDVAALGLFKESLRLFRQIGNFRGIALSLAYIGVYERVESEFRSLVSQDESLRLARTTGDPWTIAWCLQNANSYAIREDSAFSEQQAAAEDAVTLSRGTGDPFLLCHTLTCLGDFLRRSTGHLHESGCWFVEALAVARSIDDRWCLLRVLHGYGVWLAHIGRFDQAKALLSEALSMAVDHGASGYYPDLIGEFDWVARWEGRMERATRLCAAAVSQTDPAWVHPLPSMLRPESGSTPCIRLDEAAVEAEWVIGRAMTTEQAIAYALSDAD
jgi:hypothetical protein